MIIIMIIIIMINYHYIILCNFRHLLVIIITRNNLLLNHILHFLFALFLRPVKRFHQEASHTHTDPAGVPLAAQTTVTAFYDLWPRAHRLLNVDFP